MILGKYWRNEVPRERSGGLLLLLAMVRAIARLLSGPGGGVTAKAHWHLTRVMPCAMICPQ